MVDVSLGLGSLLLLSCFVLVCSVHVCARVSLFVRESERKKKRVLGF